jgi:hypothetical protein
MATDAEDKRAARRGPHEVEDDSNRGRLAGAIQAEEAEDLALMNVERDVAHGGD